jgi:TonB-linked SusC/RagA family outer membrane protein
MYKIYTEFWCKPLGFAKQFFRIMKVLLILLTTCLMQVSASTFAQRITLSEKDASLMSVFEKISKQSGYDFVITNELLSGTKPVNINVKNEALESVLDQLFENQPLSFSLKDKAVIVKKKEPSFLERVVATLTAIDAAGRVVDETGKPLPGASVKVKSSGKSVSTNAKGEFLLKGVEEGTLLVVSFIGYVSKEVDAAKEMGNLVLEISDSKLDEVQVIAYGTTTRRLSTGNTGTVTAKEIERQPVSNPLLALQGRVPGLVVTQMNGISGGAVTVRIQGLNSIGSGNDPFYVIDGIPYVSQMLTTTNGSILGRSDGAREGNGNPLSYINPSDIESIDILKDADATAIYGSRAANGAILITTKKGKIGLVKINANLQNGWGRVARNIDLMNTQQYLEIRREALRNDGIATPLSTDYDINGLWDLNRYTDWQKELIGETAQYTNVNASISGGSSIMQYLVGSTYHREGTIFPGNFADTKGSLHFNLNSGSLNQNFKIALSGNYLADVNRLPSADVSSFANQLPPNAPALYNSDGTLNWAPNAIGTSTWTNPLAQYMLRTYQNNSNNLLANMVLSYQILPGLDLKSNLGYNSLKTTEYTASPLTYRAPETRLTATRSATYSNSSISSFILEPQVGYKRNIGKGLLDVLVGITIQQRKSEGENLTGLGYNSDAVLEDIKSATSIRVNSTLASIYKYNAIYSRINYNWQDKYILNLTARRDGSSRFGSENKFHNFGAVGAAWIFTNEEFINENLPLISFGKLKGSLGLTGNDQIGDYQYLNLYSPINLGVPYQGQIGIDVNSLTNPYLQWEETRKFNIGVELGLIEDRILLTGNYSHNESSNQLLGYSLPVTTGFGSITQNFPATVQNSTWEFTLNTINITNKKFSWNSSFNFTIPKNKLVDFPGLESSSYANEVIIGQPLGFIKAFHFFGVDPATGTYQFSNKDGKPTNSPNYLEDNSIIVNPFPKFYGGFENNLNYKGFEFSLFIQFVKQTKGGLSFGAGLPGTKMQNQPLSLLNRWKKNGDITSIQRLNSDNTLGGALTYDANYNSASFIRVKNISLSYQIPEKWSNKIKLSNCKIYTQTQNLLTLTNFTGADPENGGPILRTFTIGLQIGL